MSGALPLTPQRMPPAGRAPPCTCDLLKKVDQNFSTEKFLGCEQSAVNTEYSVFARPAWILYNALLCFTRGVAPNPIKELFEKSYYIITDL